MIVPVALITRICVFSSERGLVEPFNGPWPELGAGASIV
jgi:hypothetical protein